MEVESVLRVPNPKERPNDEHGYPIDHSAVRFRKLVTVPAMPRPGDSLELSTRSGRAIASTVVRADWSEERGLFMVSCRYAKRSISADEYRALADDPDWQLKPLI